MKHKNRAPNNYGVVKRTSNKDHIIIENCINAYVDAGNDIKGMWRYLSQVIATKEITEPYAKICAYEAMNVIKSSERIYNKIIGE